MSSHITVICDQSQDADGLDAHVEVNGWQRGGCIRITGKEDMAVELVQSVQMPEVEL